MIYKGRNSLTCAQGVWLWRWTTSSWVQVDARSVGSTEVLVDRTVTGAVADLVSTAGEVRARVRCTASQAFTTDADLLRVVITRP